MTTFSNDTHCLAGTAAQRAATTPKAFSATDPGPFWFETDTGLLWLWNSASWIAVSAASVRPVLSANLSLYVATTGNDANNGLAVGTPKLTVQAAINLAATYELNGYTITINVADGTYAGNMVCAGGFGIGGTIQIVGNTTTPANVVFSFVTAGGFLPGAFTFVCMGSSICHLSGCTFSGNGSTICIGSFAQSTAYFDKVVFGTALYHMYCNGNATVTNEGTKTYTITGSAVGHLEAAVSGVVDVSSSTITLTGTPAFSGAFAESLICGMCVVSTVTFVGTATGKRYNAVENGVIHTGSGGSATYLPGSIAGTFSSGGQYL